MCSITLDLVRTEIDILFESILDDEIKAYAEKLGALECLIYLSDRILTDPNHIVDYQKKLIELIKNHYTIQSFGD